MKINKLNIVLPYFSDKGKRLDQVLASIFKKYSRTYLKNLILKKKVWINNQLVIYPDTKILGGENLVIHLDLEEPKENIAEDIFLDIIYEDNDILILNKPVGLVVHPGSGNNHGTILNALLYRYKNIYNLPRAGIVHRLDKNTSGLMVVAKTIIAYNYLLYLLKNRKIIREYQAIVIGNMISGGTINVPIMRHKNKRTCMMVHPLGKKSVTHYTIINRYRYHTHILVKLDTGRTHQIRVHMLYVGYPLVGDTKYCRSSHIYFFQDMQKKCVSHIKQFSRQALHASALTFLHPIKRKIMHWNTPLPKDMYDLLLYL